MWPQQFALFAIAFPAFVEGERGYRNFCSRQKLLKFVQERGSCVVMTLF
jgi:hypothetical protein